MLLGRIVNESAEAVASVELIWGSSRRVRTESETEFASGRVAHLLGVGVDGVVALREEASREASPPKGRSSGSGPGFEPAPWRFSARKSP